VGEYGWGGISEVEIVEIASKYEAEIAGS